MATLLDPLPRDGYDSRKSWRVLVAAGLIAAFGAQYLWGATLGLFMTPMTRELGWSRADVGLATALTAGASFVVVPAMGWTIDRARLRPLLLAGVMLQALCIAAGSQLGGRVVNFYALVLGVMLSGVCASLLVLSKIVREWFDRSLGKAMGALFAIASLGAIVNPMFAQALIDRVGWRDAYLALGAVSLTVGLALVLLVVREHRPGSPEPSDVVAPIGRIEATAMRELLRRRAWWVLATYNVFFGYAVTGLAFHFAALLQDRGATPQESAFAVSMGAVGGLLGNLTSGWLIDRYSPRLMASAVMLVPMGGVLLLLGSASVPVAIFAAVILGLSTGSEGSVIAVLTSRYFGTAVYGRAYATLLVAASLGSGLAPWIVGVLQQRSGSYVTALLISAAAFGTSAALAWVLPRPDDAGRDGTVPSDALAA